MNIRYGLATMGATLLSILAIPYLEQYQVALLYIVLAGFSFAAGQFHECKRLRIPFSNKDVSQ